MSAAVSLLKWLADLRYRDSKGNCMNLAFLKQLNIFFLDQTVFYNIVNL